MSMVIFTTSETFMGVSNRARGVRDSSEISQKPEEFGNSYLSLRLAVAPAFHPFWQISHQLDEFQP